MVGVRDGERSQGLVRNASSRAYYGILSRISATAITPRATDYRLLDRVVIDEFNRFTERNRLSRGLIDWLGFERDYLYFTAAPRTKGQSYSRIKLTRLALNSFVSHSMLPLRLAGYLGIVITFVSGLGGLFIIIERYILNDPWHLHFSGPAQLAVILVFLVGIILICLGLIALYIANIHDEVMNRPIYVVRRR